MSALCRHLGLYGFGQQLPPPFGHIRYGGPPKVWHTPKPKSRPRKGEFVDEAYFAQAHRQRLSLPPQEAPNPVNELENTSETMTLRRTRKKRNHVAYYVFAASAIIGLFSTTASIIYLHFYAQKEALSQHPVAEEESSRDPLAQRERLPATILADFAETSFPGHLRLQSLYLEGVFAAKGQEQPVRIWKLPPHALRCELAPTPEAPPSRIIGSREQQHWAAVPAEGHPPATVTPTFADSQRLLLLQSFRMTHTGRFIEAYQLGEPLTADRLRLEEVEGHICHVMLLRHGSLGAVTAYIGMDDLRLRREIFDQDNDRVDITFGDYHQVGEFLLPGRLEHTRNEQFVESLLIRHYQPNLAFDSGLFLPPQP